MTTNDGTVKKNGLFNRLWSIVAYTDEADTTQGGEETSGTAVSPSSTPRVPMMDMSKPGTPVDPTTVFRDIDPERFYQELLEELNEEPDAYSAYADAYADFGGVIPDETVRHNAALKVVAKQGITSAQIADALKARLARLDLEVKECLDENRTKMQQVVDQSQKAAASIRIEITQREQEIARMAAEIKQMQPEHDAIVSRALAAEQAISQVQICVGTAKQRLGQELVALHTTFSTK